MDAFKWKLLTILKSRGLSHLKTRKDFPPDALLEVYQQLLNETPGTLLSNELWITSRNSRDWLNKVNTYARSLAAMSMVGYVLGLGDRHLDNILIDFRTGHVTHIDFNVCFDKGASLRVPETVPFRLTQNLEKALGVTSVEGTFRVTCEEVLKSVRHKATTLMMILEAFAWDPLTEWVGDRKDEKEKVSLERVSQMLSLYVHLRGMSWSSALTTFDSKLASLMKSLSNAVEFDRLSKRHRDAHLKWKAQRDQTMNELSRVYDQARDITSVYASMASQCLKDLEEVTARRVTLDQARTQCLLWQQRHASLFLSLSSLPPLTSLSSHRSSLLPLLSSSSSLLSCGFAPQILEDFLSCDTQFVTSVQSLLSVCQDSLEILHCYRDCVKKLCSDQREEEGEREGERGKKRKGRQRKKEEKKK